MIVHAYFSLSVPNSHLWKAPPSFQGRGNPSWALCLATSCSDTRQALQERTGERVKCYSCGFESSLYLDKMALYPWGLSLHQYKNYDATSSQGRSLGQHDPMMPMPHVIAYFDFRIWKIQYLQQYSRRFKSGKECRHFKVRLLYNEPTVQNWRSPCTLPYCVIEGLGKVFPLNLPSLFLRHFFQQGLGRLT
jgi:hypothetical protein